MLTLVWDDAGFTARGVTWRVLLMDELEDADGYEGDQLDGITSPLEATIKIRALASVKRIYEVYGHEMVHAMSGRKVQIDLEKAAEEYMAQRLEGVLWQVFAQFGARPPALPAGFDEFRKRCRDAAKAKAAA